MITGTAFFSISFIIVILQVPTQEVIEPGRDKYIGHSLIILGYKLQWVVADFLKRKSYGNVG